MIKSVLGDVTIKEIESVIESVTNSKKEPMPGSECMKKA